MKGRDFIFHCVDLLRWIAVDHIQILPTGQKKKKTAINSISVDDKCFYTLFIKIMKKLEKISKNIKNEAYPNKCNWKGVNYTLVKDD